MKGYWKTIYLTLSKYKNKYNPKKEEIESKYDKLVEKLREKEKKELENLSSEINKEVNPDNLDIFVSGMTLHYKLGEDIGSVIRVKLKKDLKEKPLRIEEYLKIKDDFIFTYKMVDRDGIFMFVSDEWEGWLEATCILAYFDVEVIHC